MKDTKFKKGESGNPNGRPRGSKDKRTEYRELFQEQAPALVAAAVEKALDGDVACLKLCIDRIVSPYRSTDKTVELPDLAGTLTEQGNKIILAIGEGEITPRDGRDMLAALAAQARIVEICDLEERVKALEDQQND